jgi:hypothetical protein
VALATRYVRTGAAFLATRLTGAALALTLFLTFGTVDRTATLTFGLVAFPAAGRPIWVSFPADVPDGFGLTSACAEVVPRASPTTTTTVAIRILSSHRAALALATPAGSPLRRISLAPRRGAPIDQCNLPASGPQPS